MKIINKTLISLALATGLANQIIAMELSTNNNVGHASKFAFTNVNREDGLGTLSLLPDEKVFEVLLFCIDWDKTTLQDAFKNYSKRIRNK